MNWEEAFERWWEVNKENYRHDFMFPGTVSQSGYTPSTLTDGALEHLKRVARDAFRDSVLCRIEVK